MNDYESLRDALTFYSSYKSAIKSKESIFEKYACDGSLNTYLVLDKFDKITYEISKMNHLASLISDWLKMQKPSDLNILTLRYRYNMHIQDVASHVGIHRRNIYKKLSRMNSSFENYLQVNKGRFIT